MKKKKQKLRYLLRKGPKCRELVSFSWHQKLDIIMNACEAYVRRWAKKHNFDHDTFLSGLSKSRKDRRMFEVLSPEKSQ